MSIYHLFNVMWYLETGPSIAVPVFFCSLRLHQSGCLARQLSWMREAQSSLDYNPTDVFVVQSVSDDKMADLSFYLDLLDNSVQ